MYQVEETEEHLAALPCLTNHLNEDKSDLDEDSCIEITSNVDEMETELIKWTDYLQINSRNDDDDDNDDEVPIPSVNLVPYSSSEESSDNENTTRLIQGTKNSIDSTASINHSPIATQKRKRRQWSVAEKLHAIAYFEKTNSKHQTAKYMGCATKQLRMWTKNKPNLVELSSRKKGELSSFEK